MPDMSIFNERPESQDRALSVIEKLGYTFVSRGEAEKKRGPLSNVLFEDELEKFLSKQVYYYGEDVRYFSGSSISGAMRALEVKNIPDLYTANKTVHELICGGKSMEEDLPNGTRQSFDIGFIDFDHPENNIFQFTDEFEVEGISGKFARPDIVVLINGIPLVVIECKKSSVDVMEGVAQNIRNWGPEYIPQLFRYAQLVIAANPDKAMYAALRQSISHRGMRIMLNGLTIGAENVLLMVKYASRTKRSYLCCTPSGCSILYRILLFMITASKR